MILGVTGHRPANLFSSNPYSESNFESLTLFAQSHLIDIKPDTVITGMAQGWDQAVAKACVDLSIPFWAYVPFDGQESSWPYQAKDRYLALLGQADKVRIVSPNVPYSPRLMQIRNEAIVDDSDTLLALFDGVESGGTFNCVRYARETNTHVKNVWKEWESR